MIGLRFFAFLWRSQPMKTKLKFYLTLFLVFTCPIFSENSSYQVLSLGGALTDYLITISDEDFQKLSLEKSSWTPCELKQLQCWVDECDKYTTQAGGSAVNVVKGLSHLGQTCAIIGKVGKDVEGTLYIEKLKQKGVISLLFEDSLPTGRVLCFITPDGERTMCSYLGAAHKKGDPGLESKHFENVSLFHVEGYQVIDLPTLTKALSLAKDAGTLISMDMGNYRLVQEHREVFLSLIKKYVNILFANEAEAKELTQGIEPQEASFFLSNFADIVVVTMSEKGGWVKGKEEHFHFPAISTNVIDATGAGDLFSAGFLHGYLTGQELKKCAYLGTLLGSKVIQEIGAEISEENWEQILPCLNFQG